MRIGRHRISWRLPHWRTQYYRDDRAQWMICIPRWRWGWQPVRHNFIERELSLGPVVVITSKS